VLFHTQDKKASAMGSSAQMKAPERCQSRQRCQRKSNEPMESSKVPIIKLLYEKRQACRTAEKETTCV
jgi:hypothetical protein